MEDKSVYTAVIILLFILLPLAGFWGGIHRQRRKSRRDKEEMLAAQQKIIDRQEELLKELQAVAYQSKLEKEDLSRYFFRLPDFVRRLSSNPTLEQISSSVVRFLKSSLDPKEIGFFIYSLSENSLILIDSFGISDGHKNILKIPLGEGRIGRAGAKGIIMGKEDYRDDSALHRQREDSCPLRTDLCAPLAIEGALLGAINLARPQKEFNESERRILAMVADLVAVSLEHYRIVREKEKESLTDSLTGLYNKRFLSERLVVELQKCNDYRTVLSVIIFDVDHFKHYNDTNGHPAGDEILRQIAQLAKSITRKSDFVARYGGEEFVVVMSGSSKLEALNHAEHLREVIEQNPFPDGEKQPMGRITVSGGIAAFPEDALTAAELLRHADEALYRAKAGGRNVMCMYKTYEFME